ncbi:MAG: DUF4197 domain-containing protein [Cytophagales bacterium]|nr:MAG: DUF4197 domain-containing protein [Cytophagales bacterium]
MKSILLPLLILIFCIDASFAQTNTKKTVKKPVSKTSSSKPKTSLPSTISNTISTISGGTTGSGVASLTENEIVGGLKEALINAAQNSSSILNQLDGFNKNMKIRIPFPPECQIVARKLRDMGMGSKVDEFETTLNRAAEQAAKDAAPIFVNAITSMTIVDAKDILTGQDTSATSYLRKNSTPALYSAFNPTIANALNNTLATSKWKEITTIYNKIPFVSKVDTDLPRFTTNRALQGLFVVVAEQEQKIRKDPAAQVSDLLKKVFGNK